MQKSPDELLIITTLSIMLNLFLFVWVYIKHQSIHIKKLTIKNMFLTIDSLKQHIQTLKLQIIDIQNDMLCGFDNIDKMNTVNKNLNKELLILKNTIESVNQKLNK